MMLAEYLDRHIRWSQRTFGKGMKTVGITRHIEKECQEIRDNPADLTEWIDVMILAMDGYWRHGGQPADLFWALVEKQSINFGRTWPASTSDDQPTEHIKEPA